MCTAPAGNTGAATCSACEEGYYLDNTDKTCKPCNGCATCSGSASACTSCPEGKYLKTNQCIDGTTTQCDQGTYADKRTWTCKACSEITGCTACAYDDTISGPKCSDCGNKVVRTELDGSTTCVDEAGCKTDSTHFWDTTSGNACIKCSDSGSGGVDNCKTCPSKGQCDSCVDGYFLGGSSCTKCADNCAMCTSNQIDTCTACLPGFFLKDASSGECVSCDDTAQGGREGCSTCSNNPTFKCADCKPNYMKQQNGGAADDYTYTRACGDSKGHCPPPPRAEDRAARVSPRTANPAEGGAAGQDAGVHGLCDTPRTRRCSTGGGLSWPRCRQEID